MSKSAEQAAEELQAILVGISTKDLVDELSAREGVQEVRVNPYDDLEAEMIAAKKRIPKEGPARILVVID
jgi:hypothetical protein